MKRAKIKDAVRYQTVIAAIAIRYWRSGRYLRNILLKAAFAQQKTGAAPAAEVRKVEAHNGSARPFQSFRRILETRGDTASVWADADVCRDFEKSFSFRSWAGHLGSFADADQGFSSLYMRPRAYLGDARLRAYLGDARLRRSAMPLFGASRAIIVAVLSALIGVAPLPSWAQAYPSRPVQLVVGYAQGGTGDFIARTVPDTDSSARQILVSSRFRS